MKIDNSRKIIAFGYLLIALLIGASAFISIHEWQQVRLMNERLREVHGLRKNVHEAYILLLDLTMLGETVLEWEKNDSAIYRNKRLSLDSLLCTFKHEKSDTRIDSVRQLLLDKEVLLFDIAYLLNKQADYREQVSAKVPIIAQESTQPSQKNGVFLGLFKKKSKEPSTTSVMLESLHRDVLSKQREDEAILSLTVDSLAARSIALNEQLQTFIEVLDTKIHVRLQTQEEEFSESRRHAGLLMLYITCFIILLLLVSYTIIHRNITHIIRYKKEAAELIEQLEKTNQRNTELLTDRKNMMLTVSHDLRAPLTAIFGYAELLSGEYRKERREYYRDAIHSASHRMLGLLNTLLDYHRLDTGKEHPDNIPFRLKSLTETLAAEYTIQANEKKLMLHLDYEGEDVPVIGDRGRIIRIAGNLLSNAVKFTKKGAVRLHISYTAEKLTLIVSDTGVGMSKEQLCRIFNPFERFENAEPQEGFGLGMPITLALVRLLKGEIRAESDVGVGSTFMVTLPLPLYSEEFLQHQKKNAINLPRDMRIAVVENDVMVLRMTSRMLSKSKAKVDMCSNARELMEKIRSTRYDLIITDIMMPDINGYGLLELLRTSNIGNAKCVPVMAMTARVEQRSEEFEKAGFAGCVYKPFSREELLNTVLTCVKHHQTENLEIDFSVLLTGEDDDREMLELLICETERNMAELSDAVERDDRAKISALVHHLMSTWELLRIECPLMELRKTLTVSGTMDKTVNEAAKNVHATARLLVEQAGEMMKEEKA